jgi:hypothetical protein
MTASACQRPVLVESTPNRHFHPGRRKPAATGDLWWSIPSGLRQRTPRPLGRGVGPELRQDPVTTLEQGVDLRFIDQLTELLD